MAKKQLWSTRLLTAEEREIYNRRQCLHQAIRRRQRKIAKARAELADMEANLKLLTKKMKPIRAAVRGRILALMRQFNMPRGDAPPPQEP